MRIMNCIAICQVAGFSARFHNPEGIAALCKGFAAVCNTRVTTKTIDWCVSCIQWVYAHTDPQPAESTGTWTHERAYTYALCVNVAVNVAVTCCRVSTCINQMAPGSGCGGGSGSGAGITDDDTSGMPKHVLLVTYLN